MRNFNIVKLDSKGRLLIPFHIRELLNMEEGMEFVVLNNHDGEIKILPLIKGRTAEIFITIEDRPGSLAKITDVLAKYGIDIIMSQSRTIERGKIAEWHAIVDREKCKDLAKLRSDLSKLKIIREVRLDER